MNWQNDLESYTEHANNSREVTGERLHSGGLRKTVPVETIPDGRVRGAVEAIEGATSKPGMDGRDLPGFLLPGFGSDPSTAPDLYRETCGDDLPYGCMECGWSTTLGRTCRISRCPRCAASWAMDRSINPLASLLNVRSHMDRERDEHIRLHHLVVSPEPGEQYDVDDDAPNQDVLEVAWSTVKRVLRSFGVKHGYGFYHGYRGKDEHQAAPGEEEVGDDRGAWKGRLFQGEGSESLESLIDRELKESPHFHIVAVAHEVPGGELSRALEAATGWVMHRITPNGSNVSLYDAKDAARAVTYCISHTSMYVDSAGNYRSAARPFGRVDDDKPREEVKDWAEDIIRRSDVAPVTLGINASSLECPGPSADQLEAIPGVDVDEGDDEGAGAVASVPRGGSAPVRSSGREAAPGELPPDRDAWDAPAGSTATDGVESDETGEESPDRWEGDFDPDDRCGGRMRPIWTVARRLESPKWVESAIYADDLRETVREWSDELENLDPPPDPP